MPAFEKSTPIESEGYTPIKKITGSSKAGDHEILQDQHTGLLIFRKNYLTNDQSKAEELREKYEKRKKNACPYMLKCLDYSVKIKSDWCSKFYSIKAYYEYPFYDLEKILKARIGARTKFLHEEIGYVFYHVLESISYLESLDASEGHLQLNTVFYDTELQTYKLVDNFSKVTYRDRCLDYYYTNNGFKIFTPEVLKMLKMNQPMMIDYSRVDTYCLGVILLALGNLDTIYELFDLGNFTINQGYLNNLMKKMYDQYYENNPLLIEILKDLLIENPKHRPTPLQVKAKFPSYEQFKEVLAKQAKIDKPSFTKTGTLEMNTDDLIKSHKDLKEFRKSTFGFKPFTGLSYDNF